MKFFPDDDSDFEAEAQAKFISIEKAMRRLVREFTNLKDVIAEGTEEREENDERLDQVRRSLSRIEGQLTVILADRGRSTVNVSTNIDGDVKGDIEQNNANGDINK